MILSLGVILFVGIIAYFHFVQGFFSATLSAIAAVLAAVLAVGYDETVVHLLLRGTGADNIHALSLVMVFVVAYTVMRLLFDRMVPGNVRVPATVNYIGAAVMGLVAGAFSIGIFVIAVQMLPFGGTVSWLDIPRFKMNPGHAVVVPGTGNARADDSKIGDQMAADTFDPANAEHKLFVPVDDLVMNTASWVSGGALAGSRTLASVHPDWLNELFAERVAIQTGTRHVALVLPTNNPVSIAGAYRVDSIDAKDGYGSVDKSINLSTSIRPEAYKYKVGPTLKRSGDLVPLVIRVKLASTATDDEDHIFRFGLGNVRLVARPAEGPDTYGPATDYYPVGTLQDGKTVLINRADDFLFVNLGNGEAGFDAVFMVDGKVLNANGKQTVFAPGTFLNVKRLALLDLSGTPVTVGPPPADDKYNPVRNDYVRTELYPNAK